MIAGRLRYRIGLLRPVYSETDFGSTTTTYVPAGTVWAERVKISGRMSYETGEQFADYSTQFNIRDAHEVHEHWRVEVSEGQIFEVTNVIPNRERGFNTLICERVND